MGLQFQHALGHLQGFAAMIETTPGSYVAPSTDDFMHCISTSFGFAKDPSLRDDFQDGLDDYEVVDEKQTIPIQVDQYFMPGAAGVAPIQARLLRGIFGATPVVDSGVSVTYALSNTVQNCLSLFRRFDRDTPRFAEQVAGCALNELTMSFPGAEKPKMTFSGEAMVHTAVGNATIPGTAAAGATITLTTPQGRGFDVSLISANRGLVQIGSQTNGGAGFAVTARGDTSISVSPNHAGYSANDRVVPFAPTPTYVGAILGHTTGSMTVDSVDRKIQSGEVKVSKNLEYVKDEFGTAGMTDAIVGRRLTMVKAVIRAREDVVLEMSRRKDLTARNVSFKVGPTTGRYYEILCPRVVFYPGPLTVGQNGSGTLELNGVALASAQGTADPISVIVR